MPGIVGVINRGLAADAVARQVEAMVGSMMHERFYTSGSCSFPDLGIYAGWVAHQGSAAANQVFWNEDRDVALLFAGECFVGAEVRAELKRRGHEVDDRTGSWLVDLYQEKGSNFFKALNGLFSGLLIDLRHRQAFLFNDRYGIERLYWFEEDRATYFASEAKALLRVIPRLRAFDHEGLAQFLTFGCTLNWTTLFRGLRLVPGGTLWRIQDRECHRSQYFRPDEWEVQSTLGMAAFEVMFEQEFPRVLADYFASSERAGIALTGGIDTRMIMACLPRNRTSAICYTYAGPTGETRDTRVAARVAAACRLEHAVVRIEAGFFTRFGDLLERTVHVTDGCFGALGTHEIYLGEMARAKSRLRVTGVFGSEVLRGVSTLRASSCSAEWLHCPGLRGDAVAQIVAGWRRMHPVTFAAFCEVPWNIQPNLAACRSQLVLRAPFLDNSIVALAYRLPASAGNSSRLACRLIRNWCAELAAIPTDRGYLGNSTSLKRFVQRAISEVAFRFEYHMGEGMPSILIPHEALLQTVSRMVQVCGQHKYLHYRHWFRRELREYLRSMVRDIAASGSGLWNAGELENMAEQHIRGERNNLHGIAQALTLWAIERRLLRMRP